MHTRHRIPAVLAWTAGAVFLFTLALWLCSLRWFAFWYGSSTMIGVQGAAVFVRHEPGALYRMPPGWYSGRADPRSGFQTLSWDLLTNGYRFALTLWIPVALAGVWAAVAWRLHVFARRGVLAGACAGCRYDRAGLGPLTPCPECGAPPTAAP